MMPQRAILSVEVRAGLSRPIDFNSFPESGGAFLPTASQGFLTRLPHREPDQKRNRRAPCQVAAVNCVRQPQDQSEKTVGYFQI